MSRTPIRPNQPPSQPGRGQGGEEPAKPDREVKTPPVEVPTPGHTPSRQHLKPQADEDGDGSDVDNPRAANPAGGNVESPAQPKRDILESGQAPVIGLDP